PDSPTQGTRPNPTSHRLRAALRRQPNRPRNQQVAIHGMDTRGLTMNTTTYRWLLASHIEQTRALLQWLETELEKYDAAAAQVDTALEKYDAAEAHDADHKIEPPYQVGDPDPTLGAEPSLTCNESIPNDSGWHWYCTWQPGHTGDHVAGNGERVCAVWPQTPPVPVENLRAPYSRGL